MLEELHKRAPEIRERLLKPFIFKTNPAYISLLALIFAGLAGFLFYHKQFLLAGISVLLNGFFDILDGEIAKKFGTVSVFGDFIDHTFDRLADVAMFAGVALLPEIPIWLGWPTIILILLVSYLGTQAQALTGKRLYSALMGRGDRLVVLTVAGLLAAYFGAIVLYYALLVVLILSTAAFVQRFWVITQDIKK